MRKKAQLPQELARGGKKDAAPVRKGGHDRTRIMSGFREGKGDGARAVLKRIRRREKSGACQSAGRGKLASKLYT